MMQEPNGTPVVAFQGIAGAFSEEAIREFFGSEVRTLPCQTFGEIFDTVECSQADYGLLPVENAVAGSVSGAYDLLLERDLRIWAEVVHHVHHMLLAVPGTTIGALRQVRSHPQALAQCRQYLARRGLEPLAAFDTAGSARELAQAPTPEMGAIASRLAAELYGLAILDENIEDFSFNYTRFFLLARHDPPRAAHSKTSLAFAVRHEPGALFECLGEFARRNINLTKIESRPRLNQPWHYLFHLDFEGHWQDPDCEAALVGLLRRSAFVKLLGSYPAAIGSVPFNQHHPADEDNSA